MARPLRAEFPGAVYHVTARGNERRTVFGRDEDRLLWLKTVAEMASDFGVRLHGYCLMGNHFHLIVETPGSNLSAAMGWFQTTFTVRYNRRRRRCGHLFQGRYKAQVVEADAHAQELLRYLHLNPVRMGAKKGDRIAGERKQELEDWKWSSHRAYLGKEKGPEWLSKEWLCYFGRTGREARRRYRAFVEEAFVAGIDSPFEALRGGLVLGGDELWERVSGLLRAKEGQAENRWVTREVDVEKVRQWARDGLEGERDVRVKAWVMVKLGQWRRVEVARELGYRDGSAVTHLLERLEAGTRNGKQLREAITAWKKGYASCFKR